MLGRIRNALGRGIGSGAGVAIPSSETKRTYVLETARKYDCEGFVETGTFIGDTVQFVKEHFDWIVSIELSHDLAERARRRFAGDERIEIIEGDSADVLPLLAEKLQSRVLFWLDGHYSHSCTVGNELITTAQGRAPTPVLDELDAILKSLGKGSVILIDDARLFSGSDGYPTVPQIEEVVREKAPSYSVRVMGDIISILPPDRP